MEEKLVLDVEEMAKVIAEQTNIDIETVLKVLDAEDEYMIKNGFYVEK